MLCKICNKHFNKKKHNQIYCSVHCYYKNKNSKISPEKRKQYNKTRRLHRGHYLNELKEIILSVIGSKCIKCGSEQRIEIHHKIPIFRGGKNHISNIEPVCYFCHKKINHKIL